MGTDMEEIDRSFAEFVVKQGLASREQVDECAEAVRKAVEFGAAASLPGTLVGKGYISRKQADALLAKIRSAESKVTSIGGYELIETLGRGAMGVVYKARQVSMDRIVAIKVLKTSLSRNKVFVERFFREARTAAKLNHPHIVRAIDAGFDKGYHFFVMEFVDGATVGDRLSQGPFPEAEALKIAHEVAKALAHAQDHGIVHRDIKPENIMLTSGGGAKLADLGLAKSFHADSSITVDGSTLGTPHYMSPEQARGEAELDTRSDIYSLGATLFHMVTGSPPFSGETPAVVISNLVAGPVPMARALRPGLSMAVNRLIRRMMAKAPYARYQNADQLLSSIESAMLGETPKAAPSAIGGVTAGVADESRPARKQTTVRLVLGGAAAALALTVVIWLATRSPEPTPPPPPPASPTAGARAALAEAMRYVAQYPDDSEGAIERLQAVASTYPGTDSASRARKQLQDLRRKSEQAMAAVFAGLRARCDQLARDDRYGQALAHIEAFAAERASDQAATEAARLKTEIEAQAVQRYAQLTEKADAALAENDYAEARAILAPAADFGIDELKEKARQKLAHIESMEKHAEQWAEWNAIKTRAAKEAKAGRYDQAIKQIETALDLPLPEIAALVADQTRIIRNARAAGESAAVTSYVAAFDEQVKPLLATRAYAQAQQALEELSQRDDMKLAAEQFQNSRADIARLVAFRRRTEGQAVALKPGQNIMVSGKQVQFTSYKNGMLRYTAGQAESGVRLARLPGKEILALLGPGSLATDESRLQAALFLLYDKDADPLRARKLLEPVKGRPEAQRYRKMIGEAALGHHFESDEREAKAAFAELAKTTLHSAERATRLLAEFRAKYGHTRFFNQHLDDMAASKASRAALDEAAVWAKTLTTWQGHSYMYVQKAVSWYDAKELCEALGGHLLTISSQAEQAFIGEAFGAGPARPPHIWLGATDARQEGRWEWVTGEEWRFTSWLRGEPNNSWENEHWAIMSAHNVGIRWNDARDTSLIQFVCEWEISPVRISRSMLNKLGALGAPPPRDQAAEYKKRLAKRISQQGRMIPLGYLMVGILNQLEIPYQWDKSARLLDRAGLAGLPFKANLRNVPAAAALKRILDPLKLDYTIGSGGLSLRLRADGTKVAGRAKQRGKSLFDGKTLGGWQVHEGVGTGKAFVQGGYIILDAGEGPTIIEWTGDIPANNYEVELDAMRLDGINAFSNIAFPVGESLCALIVGGWGDVVGIETLDGKLANENETTVKVPFKRRQWYHIRLRVRESRIQAWIDDEKLIDLPAGGRDLSQHVLYFNKLPRFGLYTWHTKSAIRNITFRRLEPGG